jgi:hypothetical protein
MFPPRPIYSPHRRDRGDAGDQSNRGRCVTVSSRRPTDLRRNPTQFLPGLIGTEGPEAVGTQLGISDRPAFLPHPGCAKAVVGAHEMIVLLALADVLRRCFAPFRAVVGIG